MRPKPKQFNEIDFKKVYTKVVEATEETLDWLDEGWSEGEKRNENEDILDDNLHGIFESIVEAIYGKEYWDYFNSKC